jgi:hypothetical protein
MMLHDKHPICRPIVTDEDFSFSLCNSHVNDLKDVTLAAVPFLTQGYNLNNPGRGQIGLYT